jgi:hypothetical protein
MDVQSRRHFLGKALFAGAGATLLRPYAASAGTQRAAPESRASQAPQTPGVDFDPEVLAGRVVDTGRDGTLAIVDQQGCSNVRLAKPSADSSLWKAGVINGPPIAAGDAVYARGKPAANNGFIIDRLWANIDNFRAQVSRASPDVLSLREARTGNPVDAHIVELTRTVRSDSTAISGSASGIRAGEVVQVVTAGDAATNERVATLIVSLSPTVPIRPQGSPIRPLGHIDVQYNGITSWFCCGNDCSQCAHCGAHCSGCGGTNCCGCGKGACSCYECKSYLNAIAWPKIYKCDNSHCGPYQGNCSVGSGVTRHSCGTCFDIECECNGKQVRVRIRDCGPVIHCPSQSYCAEVKVKFDLTPCAFSAITSLSDGLTGIAVSKAFSC